MVILPHAGAEGQEYKSPQFRTSSEFFALTSDYESSMMPT